MKRSGPRTATKLPESLHHQLNMYALAAGAAGVSALALSSTSEAKIVYTPAHVLLQPTTPPFPLDLNHDGIVDFYLLHSFSHFSGVHFLAACQLLGSYTRGPFCLSSTNTNVVRGVASIKGRDFQAALPPRSENSKRRPIPQAPRGHGIILLL
jgi:hypothetical protein